MRHREICTSVLSYAFVKKKWNGIPEEKSAFATLILQLERTVAAAISAKYKPGLFKKSWLSRKVSEIENQQEDIPRPHLSFTWEKFSTNPLSRSREGNGDTILERAASSLRARPSGLRKSIIYPSLLSPWLPAILLDLGPAPSSRSNVQVCREPSNIARRKGWLRICSPIPLAISILSHLPV